MLETVEKFSWKCATRRVLVVLKGREVVRSCVDVCACEFSPERRIVGVVPSETDLV